MLDPNRLWQYILALWHKPPTLLVVGGAIGYLLKWVLERFAEHIAARRQYQMKVTELMVQKLHDYAEHHYIPVVSRAQTACGRLQDILKSATDISDEQLGRAMFGIAQFFDKERERSQAIGGFFLQDLNGEVLASMLQESVNRAWSSSPILRTQERVSLREEARKAASVGDFLNRLDSNLAPLRETFRQWVNSSEARTFYERLDVYWKLFLFEVNRPYAVWYGKQYPHGLTPIQVGMLQKLLDRCEREGRITSGGKRRYLRELRTPVSPLVRLLHWISQFRPKVSHD